jgi:O-antigen/teichoic acid export membrane protein
LSVIDQGMLSALNFCIGALLIRLVDKDDYGLYGQLYAGGLLAGLIVDSWIAGPLTTVASAVHENTRKLLLRRYWQRQIFWTVAMGLAAFLIVEFVPAATHHSNKNWLMAAAFGLYVIGNGLREYGRTVGFIQSDIHSVLRQDLVYVAAVLAGMLSLYLFEVIDVAHVLSCWHLLHFCVRYLDAIASWIVRQRRQSG